MSYCHLEYDLLKSLDSYLILKEIGKIADENGIKIFVVGGFVRDLLLKRENYDIDIVCLNDVFSFVKIVADKLKADCFTTYKNFGVAMIKKDNIQIEFVNARKESYNIDSRKPIVEVGTFEDDQKRRDFTINTLAIGLNKDSYGRIIDTFDGLNDLKNKIIKTPVDPNITFSDDPLRMLRAIRFASQLNFIIDNKTLDGITNCRNRINIVSKERIRDEINKIIMSDKPSIGFKLLSLTGILSIIMPYIEELKGINQIEGFSHKDVFYHTLKVLDNVAVNSDNIWLRWTALLHDIAKPRTKKFDKNNGFSFHGHEELGARMVKNIFNDLRLPVNNIKYVEKLIRLHLRPIIIADNIVTDSAIRRFAFDVGEDFRDLMILCRADITSHNPVRINQYLNNFNIVEEKVKYIIDKDYKRNLQPVITGNMIMEEFKLKPGPLVGLIKDKLKESVLNGIVENEYKPLHEFMIKFIKDNKLLKY